MKGAAVFWPRIAPKILAEKKAEFCILAMPVSSPAMARTVPDVARWPLVSSGQMTNGHRTMTERALSLFVAVHFTKLKMVKWSLWWTSKVSASHLTSVQKSGQSCGGGLWTHGVECRCLILSFNDNSVLTNLKVKFTLPHMFYVMQWNALGLG